MTTYRVRYSNDIQGELHRNTNELAIEAEVRRDVLDSLEPGESVRVSIFECGDEDGLSWDEFVDDFVVQKDAP